MPRSRGGNPPVGVKPVEEEPPFVTAGPFHGRDPGHLRAFLMRPCFETAERDGVVGVSGCER